MSQRYLKFTVGILMHKIIFWCTVERMRMRLNGRNERL